MQRQQKKEAHSFFSFPFFFLLGITFFLPFEHFLSMDIAGMTLRISHVLLLMLLLLTLALGVFNKIQAKWHDLYFFLLLYIMIALASLMFSINLSRSLTVFCFILFTMSPVFLLPLYIQEKKQLQMVLKVFIWSSILVSLFGIFQLIGDLLNLPATLTGLRPQYQKEILGFPRIQSTALEPLYFANYLILPFSLLLSFFLAKSKRNFMLLVCLLLLGCNILLTGSRGGYLGVAVCISVLLIAYRTQVFSLLTKLWIGILLIIGISLLLLQVENTILISRIDLFISHITTLFDGAAYVERSQTISDAFTLFIQKPFLGWGIGSFGPLVAMHPFTQPDSGWAIVNNQIMESLVETGIVGTLALILFAVLLCIQLFFSYTNSKDPYIRMVLIAVFAALLGIFVQYLTFSTLYILHIWYAIGLAFVCIFLTSYD